MNFHRFFIEKVLYILHHLVLVLSKDIYDDFEVFVNIYKSWEERESESRRRIWIPCVYYEIARRAYFLHVYTARSPILNMQIHLKRSDSKMKGCNFRLIIGFSDVSGGILSTSSDKAPPYRSSNVLKCVRYYPIHIYSIQAHEILRDQKELSGGRKKNTTEQFQLDGLSKHVNWETGSITGNRVDANCRLYLEHFKESSEYATSLEYFLSRFKSFGA